MAAHELWQDWHMTQVITAMYACWPPGFCVAQLFAQVWSVQLDRHVTRALQA
jgi:hypothetical protein